MPDLVAPLRLDASSRRDVRIDWLRGLAMTCVIVNHSRLSSPISWFTYERFWVVTAAEVFVVLSGVVLGMVYRKRLARDGWLAVARALSRRAALLYGAFVAVSISVIALGMLGLDVSALAASDGHTPAWFAAPQTMDVAAWRDVLLMRAAPWAFEIIGLYVWLVAAAVPCLFILHRVGWRALLAVSWALYLWYRIDPRTLTLAGFEASFPLLSWQLLFVHGLAYGYHRDRVTAFLSSVPPAVPRAAAIAAAAFVLFAFCNPWADGPEWLRLGLVSPDRFSDLYVRYFALAELGAGRLLNLAVGLPVGYALLTRFWALARPVENLFLTLGRRSLGAFVAHVYGVLALAHLRLLDSLLVNAIVQVGLVVGIAVLLNGIAGIRAARRPRGHRPDAPLPEPERLAA